jgi:hypothetical protein
MAILLIHSLHIYLLSIYSVSVDISLDGVYVPGRISARVQEHERKEGSGFRFFSLEFIFCG